MQFQGQLMDAKPELCRLSLLAQAFDHAAFPHVSIANHQNFDLPLRQSTSIGDLCTFVCLVTCLRQKSYLKVVLLHVDKRPQQLMLLTVLNLTSFCTSVKDCVGAV